MSIPIREQISCVKRELALRERVYPSFVDRGKLTPRQAATELERMKAVLDTLLCIASAAGVEGEIVKNPPPIKQADAIPH